MKVELIGFDEFWSIYPRKVAKQAAMRAYAKALKLTTSAVIFGSAEKYARDRSGQDATYTAHPATWLNAGRWDDYQPQAMPASTTSLMGVYVAFDAPEMDAWVTYERKTRKSFPRDRAGGWWFPTRWPPEEKAA